MPLWSLSVVLAEIYQNLYSIFSLFCGLLRVQARDYRKHDHFYPKMKCNANSLFIIYFPLFKFSVICAVPENVLIPPMEGSFGLEPLPAGYSNLLSHLLLIKFGFRDPGPHGILYHLQWQGNRHFLELHNLFYLLKFQVQISLPLILKLREGWHKMTTLNFTFSKVDSSLALLQVLRKTWWIQQIKNKLVSLPFFIIWASMQFTSWIEMRASTCATWNK